MAIDPATAKAIAKVVISQITDEEKRQRLIIGIIISIVVLVFIIMIPLFAITSTIDKIASFFSFGDDGKATDSSYEYLIDMNTKHSINNLEKDTLVYNGTMPMPVNNAVVTSEYGSRIHPVTGKQSFHTGIDLAGAWHSNIMSVEKGKIVFAGVQTGYGNCIEIEHITEEGVTYYTFYAHLARIDVVEGQEVEQGSIIAIQGGDPNRDPNPGYSTGSHLHFEVRKSKNGDFQNPRNFLFGDEAI